MAKNEIKSVYISTENRSNLLGNTLLLDYLQRSIAKGFVFHASKKYFTNIVPHKSSSFYKHGKMDAIYATDLPQVAIFYSLINKEKLKSYSFYLWFIDENRNREKNVKFFASADVRANFNNGYIYLLNNDICFKNINNDLIINKEVSPAYIYETEPNDLVFTINPVPFFETKYDKNKIFNKCDRQIIREFFYRFIRESENFELIDRYTEITFDLALEEAPKFANEIFLSSFLYKISSRKIKFEFINGYLEHYWSALNTKLIKRLIFELKSRRPYLKFSHCLSDAEIIAGFNTLQTNDNRCKTKSGKQIYQEMLDSVILSNNFDCDYRRFLRRSDLNNF